MNKKNVEKLINRAKAIQETLENVKPLYSELDEITLALAAVQKGLAKYGVTVADNFAVCEGCERPECQDCCEHEFDADEGYTCLGCGKDGSEDVFSAAYDRIKDIQKYGE